MLDTKNLPRHVAIIMDGNGRWARRRGLPRIAGHRAGAKTVDRITECARELGIKVLTLYAFSTENWKRSKREISALFKLLENYLEKEADRLNRNNIRLSIIGDMEELPNTTQDKLHRVMELTKGNDAMVLNVALNYGSRSEMVRAVRQICDMVKSGKMPLDNIDEKTISSYLYTKDLPDPDLLIRTSGEFRVSNFLLWQISYAEIYVTQTLWPDFKRSDFEKALSEYQKRERRFGR